MAKARTINRPDDTEKTIESLDGKAVKDVARERAIDAQERAAQKKREGRIDPEKIADLNQFNSKGLYHINFRVHEFKFREAVDNVVSFFYPHAEVEIERGKPKGKGVYVDVVRTDRQMEIAREKAEIMQKAGRVYYIYLPDGGARALLNPIQDESDEDEEDDG